MKLIDQWMASIDKGDTVGALFIDFRKAFDLVDHNILINKLSAYKFNNMSLKWFTSYLESRQQAIDSGLGFSSFSTINKKSKRKVQVVPKSHTAALPRPEEEEETDKSKQAQTEQTYEKH